MTVPTPGRGQTHLAACFPGADSTTGWADPRSPSRPQIEFSSFEQLTRTAERGLFDLAGAVPGEGAVDPADRDRGERPALLRRHPAVGRRRTRRIRTGERGRRVRPRPAVHSGRVRRVRGPGRAAASGGWRVPYGIRGDHLALTPRAGRTRRDGLIQCGTSSALIKMTYRLCTGRAQKAWSGACAEGGPQSVPGSELE